MTDEKLAVLARTDKRARERLLNKYTPLVKSVAARFFIHGGEAQDLEQEGMMGLNSAINSFEDGCGAVFSTYAYACARNAVLDAVKKSVGDKQSALNDFVPIVEVGVDAYTPTPEDEVIKSENRREFLRKISKALSSFEFKVMVMRLDGMGVSEISETLEKSQKSVSNALARSKVKLEKLYGVKD
ncbi:MAG: sigma-70 family RNA polymerase sigma factor [Clostridia bacterium]|nr:sigma-70 family RNA polymerase sigma factor [Clostridia bacterium]